ncbi:antitoxin MazE family protein [Bordetella sp. BOR01]|nr:antitoxin MazE family protein [Bordetella sp. BOR01]
MVSTSNVDVRVDKHRTALRMAGLRPVQIWVPDTRQPNFAEVCRRQSILAAAGEAGNVLAEHGFDELLHTPRGKAHPERDAVAF